ncbi:uncharacterized protein LOC141850457 [Brevipalpus obovatus]|uniref:uncharacterized protein LOC141850457 n=1 Tax=Brevipalpus obovatus TaxID=246614 RepID=UPI003D9EFE5E
MSPVSSETKKEKEYCWKCSSPGKTGDFACKRCKQKFHTNCDPDPEKQKVELSEQELKIYCKECTLKDKSAAKANKSKNCSQQAFGKSFDEALKEIMIFKQEKWTKDEILSGTIGKCSHPGDLLYEKKRWEHMLACDGGGGEQRSPATIYNIKILESLKGQPDEHKILENLKRKLKEHKIFENLKNELEDIERCVWCAWIGLFGEGEPDCPCNHKLVTIKKYRDTRRKCDIGSDESDQLDRMAEVEYGKLIGFTEDKVFVRLIGAKQNIKVDQRIVYKYKKGQTHLAADQNKFKLAEKYAMRMKEEAGHDYEQGVTLASRRDGLSKPEGRVSTPTRQENDENEEELLVKIKAKLKDMACKRDPALQPLLDEIRNDLEYASLPEGDSEQGEKKESDDNSQEVKQEPSDMES